MTVRVKVTGLPAIEKLLKAAPRAVKSELREGLIDEAQAVITEAQKRVPVFRGPLRASAYVRAKRSTVEAGYDAPHAVYVHEIPYDGHTTRGAPGAMRNGEGYKWLAKAAKHVLRTARERLARRIRGALAKSRKKG